MRSLAWLVALPCLSACLDFDQFRGPDGSGGDPTTVTGSTTSTMGGDPTAGGTGGTGGEPSTTSTGGMGGQGGTPAIGPCVDAISGDPMTDAFQSGPQLDWISSAGPGVFAGGEVRIDSNGAGDLLRLDTDTYDVTLDDCYMAVEVTAPSVHTIFVHWFQPGGPGAASIYITGGLVELFVDGVVTPLDMSSFSVGYVRFRSEGSTLFIETGDGTSWVVRAEETRPGWMDAEGEFVFGVTGSGTPDQPHFDNVNLL